MCPNLPYIRANLASFSLPLDIVAAGSRKRDMENPVRVLVVEHRYADRSIAGQLLMDHDLDFRWQCVASPRELCKLAAEFDPTIVLCTDDLSMGSSHAVLDALRLLCSQRPDILVSSLREAD